MLLFFEANLAIVLYTVLGVTLRFWHFSRKTPYVVQHNRRMYLAETHPLGIHR